MRNMFCFKLIPFFVLVLYFNSSVHSGEQASSEMRLSAKINSVSCYSEEGKILGSKTTEAPPLLSPDGKRRATVIVKTTYDPDASKNPPDPKKFECYNISQLMISDPSNATAVAVFTAPPLPEASEPGNNIELADWSKDGRYLAATYLKWAYFSDWFHFDLLVYDSRMKKMIEPNVESVFTKRFGKQCSIELRALGFDEDGVSPVIEAWDSAGEESCVGDAALWRVDLQRNTVTPLPKGFKVSRFGRLSK